MLAASTVAGCGQASTETNSDAAVEEQTNQLVAAAESLFTSHGAEQGLSLIHISPASSLATPFNRLSAPVEMAAAPS